MQVTISSVNEIEQALRSAAAAHGEHEKETGQVDADWPAWYARHIARTLGVDDADGSSSD